MSLDVSLWAGEYERRLEVFWPADFEQLPFSVREAALLYMDADKGIECLDQEQAGDCLPILWKAFTESAAVTPGDTWEYSAGYFFMLLWSWAKANPKATFRVCM